MHKEMQRQRHKGTYIGRGSQMHKWTLTCKPKHIQNHTPCCTRALRELQLKLKWYVIKSHGELLSPGDPHLQRARSQPQGGPIP